MLFLVLLVGIITTVFCAWGWEKKIELLPLEFLVLLVGLCFTFSYGVAFCVFAIKGQPEAIHYLFAWVYELTLTILVYRFLFLSK